MNFPSTLGGNWEWRLTKEQISDGLAEFIGNITRVSGRWMAEPEKETCSCYCADTVQEEQGSEKSGAEASWKPRRECEFQLEK